MLTGAARHHGMSFSPLPPSPHPLPWAAGVGSFHLELVIGVEGGPAPGCLCFQTRDRAAKTPHHKSLFSRAPESVRVVVGWRSSPGSEQVATPLPPAPPPSALLRATASRSRGRAFYFSVQTLAADDEWTAYFRPLFPHRRGSVHPGTGASQACRNSITLLRRVIGRPSGRWLDQSGISA